jgi:hypothetical protein
MTGKRCSANMTPQPLPSATTGAPSERLLPGRGDRHTIWPSKVTHVFLNLAVGRAPVHSSCEQLGSQRQMPRASQGPGFGTRRPSKRSMANRLILMEKL